MSYSQRAGSPRGTELSFFPREEPARWLYCYVLPEAYQLDDKLLVLLC